MRKLYRLFELIIGVQGRVHKQAHISSLSRRLSYTQGSNTVADFPLWADEIDPEVVGSKCISPLPAGVTSTSQKSMQTRTVKY